MRIIRYPQQREWSQLCARPHLDNQELAATVSAVLADVREHGDEAVIRYEERFDHVSLQTLAVTKTEMDEALAKVDADLLSALRQAHENISRFHESQRFEGRMVETCPGVKCWQKSVPIEKVGLYIPGGTAPLFSTVLMLATPARIAGCQEIVLCTPPDKTGHVHPAILAAAHIAGVNKIFKAGGVQAIGAMAYGTESIPQVYKIFGPGNQYVMAAKQQVSTDTVAIDMPAGPSEVCVVVDDTSDTRFATADLLSQAEHGVDSQVVLVSTSQEKLEAIVEETTRQLAALPRRDKAEKSLDNSLFILVHNTDEAIAFSNEYAPEHLILSTADYKTLAEKVINAGSVFMGRWACESAGDYASGTNHTLPTHGWAKSYSGVNLDSFIRKVTFQELTGEGIDSIGKTVEKMAAEESLEAHRRAMTYRIEQRKEEQ